MGMIEDLSQSRELALRPGSTPPIPRLTGPSTPPATPGGPIARAALAGGSLLAGGAAATAAATGTVAANPDYFKTSIGDDGLAANILSAARETPDSPIARLGNATPPAQTARTAAGPLKVALGGASGEWNSSGDSGPIAQLAQPAIAQQAQPTAARAPSLPNKPPSAANPAPTAAPTGPDIGALEQQIAALTAQRSAHGVAEAFDQQPGRAGWQGSYRMQDGSVVTDVPATDADRQLVKGVSVIAAQGPNGTPFEQDGKQYRTIEYGVNPLGQPFRHAVSINGGNTFDTNTAVDLINQLPAAQRRVAGLTPEQQAAIASHNAAGEQIRALQNQIGAAQGFVPHTIKSDDPGAVYVEGQRLPESVFHAGQTRPYLDRLNQGAITGADPYAAATEQELAKVREENRGKTDVASITANAHNRSAELQYQAGKVPPGYRLAADGTSMEPIPGTKAAADAREQQLHVQNSVASTDTTLGSIDRLLAHPGRTWATGSMNLGRFVPGTDGADFAAELATLKAQTFVPMVSQLKGMGALSDAEGKKLTEAVGALDVNMSEQGFVDSLTRIKADLSAAKQRLLDANPKPAASPKPGAQPATGWNAINAAYAAGQPTRNAEQLTILQHELQGETNPANIAALQREIGRAQGTPKPELQAGTIEDGHRFKGGNPADPTAWEQIK